MGICFVSSSVQQRSKINVFYKVNPNNLNFAQQFLLKLIYNDLKQRIPQKTLNLQNFLLFFHKNDFWGIQLFHQFSTSQNIITQQQFIDGMGIHFFILQGKLIKTDEDQRIKLLFKFFSNSRQTGLNKKLQFKGTNNDRNRQVTNKMYPQLSQKGVRFDDFLRMLYNYPKQDLKQILNDKDFFQKEIRNSLVTIGENHRLESVYNLKLSQREKDHLIFRIEEKQQASESTSEETEALPSLLRKDILKQIKQRQIDQTTIKLNDGNKTLVVKTNNIHSLVKKFAINMFKSLNLDVFNGQQFISQNCRLNQRQFTAWIKNHNTLYKNYYKGFHNDIWEYDPQTQQSKFLTTPSQKQDIAIYQTKDITINAFIMLKNSFMIICQQEQKTTPIDIVFLQGLEVNTIFQQQKGYGFAISHRDGFYIQKKLFFKNQTIRESWNEQLKYFRGQNIQKLYTLGKKIGTGKFSVVYEATSRENFSQVAIKVIDYKELDSSAQKMIQHQSSIMQNLSHPFLVHFIKSIQTKTHLYIITQLCPGRDLFQIVKNVKHLNQNQSAAIIQQVIVGVRYLHSLGIVHRDLKPENIMVDFDAEEKKVETVKIIDFGFANYLTAFSKMTPDQALAGTPNYIAPQLLKGEQISYKCDNFAIGSILYFILSGNLPFNSHSFSEIFLRTIQGNYSFKGKHWDKISSLAKDLINGFLQPDPQKRLSLELALLHPWFREYRGVNLKTSIDRQSTSSQYIGGVQSTRGISY